MKWIKQIKSQLCPLSIYAKTKPEAQTEVNVSGVKRLLRVQLWRMWRHRQQLRELFWMHGHLCKMVQCNEKINPTFTQVTPYSVEVVRVPNSLSHGIKTSESRELVILRIYLTIVIMWLCHYCLCAGVLHFIVHYDFQHKKCLRHGFQITCIVLHNVHCTCVGPYRW